MLQVAGASVHWYGKADVALQRKIGHVTITAPDRDTALTSLKSIDSAAAAALSTSTGKPNLCGEGFVSLVIVAISPLWGHLQLLPYLGQCTCGN